MKITGVLFGIASTALAAACCGIGAKGASVRFTGQSNIVIWDAAKGIEHFVRNAQFATTGKDLGFIAPTPTEPTLSDVDIAAFDTLSNLKPPPPGERGPDGSYADTAAAASSVSVISEQNVGGYHATILKATDAKGLSEWLSRNGYPAPTFLQSWSQRYVEKGWFFTAFKVNGGEFPVTGPVRMSFATTRPFNPYSVPAENGGGEGSPLTLFYVSAGDEVPLIGGKEQWRNVDWSAPVPEEAGIQLASQLRLPAEAIPKNATVASYIDYRFGRPGFDDLYFVPDNRKLYRNAAVGAVVLVIAYAAVRRRRKVPAAV